MNYFLRRLILITIFIISLPAAIAAQTQTGKTLFSFFDKARNKTILVECWYPITEKVPAQTEKSIWQQTKIAMNAPVNLQFSTARDGKLPLIVLSHGYKGNPQSLSWFAVNLVKHGFIVIAAQHNDAGPNSKPYMEHWQRAIDVSFILRELQHTDFAKNIDFNRVGMAGYSVGTSTGLWLAGALALTYDRTVNPGRQFVPEEEFPPLDSDIANYLQTHTDFQAAKKSYREPLIKAVFLIAPGYGWAFPDKQLANVTIPIFIVAAEKDEMLYPETNAYYFSKYLPNSAMKIIPEVGHFIFINETRDLADKELTVDEKKQIEDVKHLGKFHYTTQARTAVHQLVDNLAANFFLTNLQ